MDPSVDRSASPLAGTSPGAVPPPGAPGSFERETAWYEPFERLFATWKRMGSNYATLAVLDVRRAAVQFAWLVAGGILVAVLVVTAWLAAVIAVAVWLLGQGMSWEAVLLIAAALNLVGAAIVGMRMRNVFDQMPFAATLRHFRSDDSKDKDTAPPGSVPNK